MKKMDFQTSIIATYYFNNIVSLLSVLIGCLKGSPVTRSIYKASPLMSFKSSVLTVEVCGSSEVPLCLHLLYLHLL